MRYALLIYGKVDVETGRRRRTGEESMPESPRSSRGRDVTGHGSGCNGRDGDDHSGSEEGKTLITDGPFVDSKDFLGGLIVVEAENLDGALAVADDLQELGTAARSRSGR